MKKLYLLSTFILVAFILQAQSTTNSISIAGSCLNSEEGTIDLIKYNSILSAILLS